MKKLVMLIFLLMGFCGVLVAQSTNKTSEADKEGLVHAISENQIFKEFISKNERYLELREVGGISESEREIFHKQQKMRVDNLKEEFPQLEELPKEEKQKIIRQATRIVMTDIKE